jgi:hypothetical protein
VLDLHLQSESITSTFYGYEIQLSKLYTRNVFNKFKETLKSSTAFGIREDAERNSYYLVEHRKVETDFPWLQHAFRVKAVYNEHSPEGSIFSCECLHWDHTGIETVLNVE